jgi:outer membrane protein insertion porin family
MTAPYSLFNNVDYANLENQEEFKTRNEGTESIIGADGKEIKPGEYTKVGTFTDALGTITTGKAKVDSYIDADTDAGKVDQKKFNWLEYYKIKFKADWYNKIYGKLVLRTTADFAFLGSYNSKRGMIPFERFFLGGDGMANYSMDGRENVQLRGYPNNSLTPYVNGYQEGATVYNKFSMELRYPITLKSSASIFALTFLEAGNAYTDFKSFQPFNLKRSAGFGVRVFMPAFGMLGIDFAHGFDALPGESKAHGWETHFIIGQQF